MEGNIQPLTIPCGSPNCLAVTMEDLLTKHTETLSINLKSLMEVHMEALAQLIDRAEAQFDKNITRLEQKHDNDLREVCFRLGNVESIANVVKDRQVGIPKCVVDMSEMRSYIAELTHGSFTTEEKQKILTIVDIIQSNKKIWIGITITVVSMCILGLISFGLFMFGSHNPDKRITEIEQSRIQRSEEVNKSLQKLQEGIETNRKLLGQRRGKE